MHLTELDIGGMVKAFLLTLFCLFLVVAPVSAQQAPTPAAPTDPNVSWGHLAVELVQAVGTSGALSLIISVGFVLLIYRTYKPMLDAAREDRAELRAEREERDKEREERQMVTQKMAIVLKDQADSQKDALEQRGQISDALGRSVDVLKNIRDDAKRQQEEIQANSNAARDNINLHTDEQVGALTEKVDGAIEILEDLRKTAVTQEKFDGTINPLVAKIDEALREMRAVKLPSIVNINGEPPPTPETPSST